MKKGTFSTIKKSCTIFLKKYLIFIFHFIIDLFVHVIGEINQCRLIENEISSSFFCIISPYRKEIKKHRLEKIITLFTSATQSVTMSGYLLEM